MDPRSQALRALAEGYQHGGRDTAAGVSAGAPPGQASMLVDRFLIRRSQVRILLLHERRELVEVL